MPLAPARYAIPRRRTARRRPSVAAVLLVVVAQVALLAGILGVHASWIAAALIFGAAAMVIENRRQRDTRPVS
ncbi:hypothetical protein [Cryptosporangium japonicum]|uniref:Uncharacterized protein n=1 Tax=Cryptosporangium japonicum TaxID=80872 RepID=A0ABN0U9N4_9ACTN